MKPRELSPFASLVLEAMTARGLGLRALCRAVSLDPSFFSKALSGKRSPPAEDEVLRKIAAALGLDPVRLILSTGRLPEEMKSLWQEPDLRRAKPARAAREASSWSAPQPSARAAAPAPKPGLAEELL